MKDAPTAAADTGGFAARWLPVLFAAAAVGGLLLLVSERSEAGAVPRLLGGLSGWALGAVIVAQALTYVAQAKVFDVAVNEGRLRDVRPPWWAVRLTLAKLFVDQTVPSAGLSGTGIVVATLDRRGVPGPRVAAAALINLSAYYFAYVACLLFAGVSTAVLRRSNEFILASVILFILFALLIGGLALMLPGRTSPPSGRLMRLPGMREIAALLAGADVQRIRDRRVILVATLWHVAGFLCDAATVWILLRALGSRVNPDVTFSAFMIASVFRTVGVAPGGLGSFEAALVFILRSCGVPLAAAATATLLFRAVSFWVPLAPGLLAFRRLRRVPGASASSVPSTFWSEPIESLYQALGTSSEGLTTAEASGRLEAARTHQIRHREYAVWRTLLRQVGSPLILLLVFASIASWLSGDIPDAAIVLSIVVATAAIGFWREHTAERAAAALRARIRTRASVMRDGQSTPVALDDVVPGDVVLLSAGSLVPGDARILESSGFYVNEAVLTGESFPIEKQPGTCAANALVRERTNAVFLGTNVRSGTARCLVVQTGADTAFGAVAARLVARAPLTEFDRGIRRFGYLLTIAMLSLVFAVFAAHMLQGHPPVQTLLFSIALAVGLSPELLPAILTVNLARGARTLAHHGVLVRRLNAIENLGSMDVLCSDKTGTLTQGVVRLEGAYDPAGRASPTVLTLGTWNASLQTGLANPLDDAIVAAAPPEAVPRKLSEVPFDFVRKRVGVVIAAGDGASIVVKGSVANVLSACSTLAGGLDLTPERRRELLDRADAWNANGTRVLAVAVRTVPIKPRYGPDDEDGLEFTGFLTFLDAPKAGMAGTLRELREMGVAVKMITGDAGAVARHVAGAVGLTAAEIVTGEDLRRMNEDALVHVVDRVDVFAEVDPDQKERLIRALRRAGHVVGFLGDGVNDAPAMHSADTSLSVDDAVDVAREAADFVLLEQDLEVIRRGIAEGRRTFANTLKYILTTTSANLGNMLSMAVASLFLPFLPLLPGQILLNNFLSDIPALGIAEDGVDPEMVARPERWHVRFVGRFMVEFGVISSLFDLLTFAVLLWVYRAAAPEFRTAWFVESLLTELVVAFVMRTRRPFFRSRPGRLLLWSSVALIVIALAIPALPAARVFGFVPLPASLMALVCVITIAYVATTELAKHWFYAGVRGGSFRSPSQPNGVGSRRTRRPNWRTA